jgi:hypothetical protein
VRGGLQAPDGGAKPLAKRGRRGYVRFMATQESAKPAAPAEPVTAEPLAPVPAKPAVETGGPKGPEPTRFGDWERNGRCIDF